MSKDSNESPPPVSSPSTQQTRASSRSPSTLPPLPHTQVLATHAITTTINTGSGSSSSGPGAPSGGGGAGGAGVGGKRSMSGPHPAESPAKKQSKWSPEEDALIIDLRGRGMKWEDISKQLPGRSAISCRLHYQNYLERRSEWDEDRKNKLARLYERFKPEMWSKVAEEMAVPWRAAEAMHWNLGENDMARRAGVVPFSLSSATIDAPPGTPGGSGGSSRGHSHSHSTSSSSSSTRFQHQRGTHSQPSIGTSRSLASRRESTPRSAPPLSPSDGIAIAGIGGPLINPSGRGQQLPSVAEMTTGVSPYNTPAYSLGMGMSQGYSSPGPMLPPVLSGGPPSMMPSPGPYEKRRTSPDIEQRDLSRRRQ